MASVLLIYLWVDDEWSVDRYHVKDNRLFQVMEHKETENGVVTSGHTQDFLAQILKAEMPEIEDAVTSTPPFFFPAFTLTMNGKHVKAVGKYAGQDFFKVFSYHLLQGDKDEVLTDKNAIVVSESIAKSLFPDISDVVGKTVEYDLQTLRKQVIITGVFKDVPGNSSEQFDVVFSFDAFRDIIGIDRHNFNWDAIAPFFTYVTLQEGAVVGQFNEKLRSFLRDRSAKAAGRTLFLKPFSDNYLYGTYENGELSGGRIEYVRMFSLVALFVLVLACINFVNLSTARASRRIREIGVKKAVGAGRGTMITQYITESMMMSSLSMVLAILFVDLLLPHINAFGGKHLHLNFDAGLITAIVALAIVTGFTAGIYPAFYLSAFNTADALRSRVNSFVGELWARKGLVVFQFSISVIFIVGVFVVYNQMEYVRMKNLGYERDNVLYFETNGKVAERPETFLSEIRKMPGVVNASSMLGNVIGGNGTSLGGGTPGVHSWQGKDVIMNVSQVNYDLIETLGIEIVAGRSFSRDAASDTLQLIYNETAVQALGLEDPVGKILPGGFEIVGVAEDFHYNSLHLEVQPHCLILEPEYAMNIFVKLAAGYEQETIQAIASFFKRFNPGFEFHYNFLDEAYNAQYAAENKVASLSQYFSILAILISCLGLFGLAAFTAEKRTKEIGIRKVLGAGTTAIVMLLTSEFSRIVFLSVAIASPLSYLLARNWLDRFAYKSPMEWWYFPTAGMIALSIAWLTVGFQAWKAARINPVKCLRDE